MIHVNDTLRFVLPMFYDTVGNLNKEFFFNEFFKGAYTSDFKRPEYDDKLILVYEYFPSEEYIEFENKFKVLLNPIIYQDGASDTYLYVLDIPNEYTDDYTLITSGIFNKLSPHLKLKIIKMWNLTDEDQLFKVLVGKEEYVGEPFETQVINLEGENEYAEI